MPYNEHLAQRVRDVLSDRAVPSVEKKMMGGLCYMVKGKMCLGVLHDRLMVRLDPDAYDAALSRAGCVPMDFTGRPMRGFAFVNPEGTRSKKDLAFWIDLALEFNPRAKASKQRKRATRKKTTGTRTSRK